LTNYPNPFDQLTTIKFGLQQQSNVTLSVYNLVGKQVFESTKNSVASGTYEINFDGSNLSNGIYLYKISAIGKDGQAHVAYNKMTKTK
jgi:hypothetical protein